MVRDRNSRLPNHFWADHHNEGRAAADHEKWNQTTPISLMIFEMIFVLTNYCRKLDMGEFLCVDF